MKLYILSLVLAAAVLVECKHTFLGSNLHGTLVYHHSAQYMSKFLRKRIENIHYSLPNGPSYFGRSIQGVLAYDMTHSGASANVTQGGLGFNFVDIRMKSDPGTKLHFDIYIYA